MMQILSGRARGRNVAAALWLMIMLGSLLGFSRAARAVSIRVTYTDASGEGFNDARLGTLRRRAFEAAAAKWGALLTGTVPIDVSARMDALGGSSTSATLGQAGPRGFATDWNGGTQPLPNTYYALALANQLAGQDLEPGGAEISAQFNSDVDNGEVLGGAGFYYGLDGRVQGPDGILGNYDDPIDFFSVVLHELGHGLGFLGFINQDGSFDDGAISIYDRFLANGPSSDATFLIDLQSDARAAVLVSNSLYFAGPNARAANGGINARLYAPRSYIAGSSVSHLDEETYSGINELMTPIASEVAQNPGPVTLGILRDLGWRTSSTSPTPIPTTAPNPTPLPVVRPANDAFEKRQLISGATGSVAGSTVNATKQSGEPDHSQNRGGHSIWYQWTAPATGRISFSTARSDFDTTLAAYSGSALSSLLVLDQNDDVSESERTSRISFEARIGVTYVLAVDGFFNVSGNIASGLVRLEWNLVPAIVAPANDAFARAQVLSGTAGRVTGTNVGASKESGEPNHANLAGGRSVWYRWRAPVTARWTFTTAQSTLDTLLAVYSGSAVNALRAVGFDDDDPPFRTSSVSFNAVAGTTYFIAVDGKNGASGSIVLSWTPAPRNDLFVNALLLTVASGRLSSSNVAASAEIGEPRHAYIVGGQSVWYRWRAPTTGRATFNTTGSAIDTLLAVYSGAAVNALRPVAYNDNAAAGMTSSSVAFNAVAGTTYNIAVDGKAGASGSFVLQWSIVPSAPANDHFARAQEVSGSAGSVFGTNVNATREAREVAHGGVGVGRSVWYEWASPGAGRAFFATTNSTFDSVLAVYAYGEDGVLRLVTDNDDASSSVQSSVVSFPVGAGDRFFVVVDGAAHGGLISGSIKLSWAFRP